MKIMIIDEVLNELNKMKKTGGAELVQLYGLRFKDKNIITATKSKEGLEKTGLFWGGDVESAPLNLGVEFLVHLEDGEPVCFRNPDEENAEVLPVELINYATDFNKRLKGIVDDSQVKGKTVAAFGIGSGGGAGVLDLVRSGVDTLILGDNDIVGVGNICRSVYDLSDVGKKKTDAMIEKIMRINPYAKVEVYDEDILEMEREKLLDIIDRADLIIEGTDNVKTKILVNGLAHETTPVIYPSVYEHGSGGDILFTMPKTPCFECVFRSIMSQMGNEKREWDYSTGEPKPMPALIADIQVVVARTVKLALAILTKDGEHSFFDKVTEPGCTLLMIANERGVSVFEDDAFGEVWVKTEINPDCVCQTLQ